MTTKDFLNRLWVKKNKIEGLQKHIKDMEMFADSCSATLSAVPSGKSFNTSKVENLATTKYELELELENEMKAYEIIKDEILVEMCKLDSCRERTLLFKRYIEFKSWDIIAHEFNLTKPHMYNLHRKALKNLSKTSIIPR